jgi:hypothetical protein
MGIYKGVIHHTKTHIHKCQSGEQFLSFNPGWGHSLTIPVGKESIDRLNREN